MLGCRWMLAQCLLFFSSKNALNCSSVIFGTFSGRNILPYCSSAAFCAVASEGFCVSHLERIWDASLSVIFIVHASGTVVYAKPPYNAIGPAVSHNGGG